MKRKRWWIVCAAALVVCCAMFIVFGRSGNSGLGRDKDNEFLAGSKITLEDLNADQEENLYKLAKVWGFVKYYHPAIIAGDINWDAELFRVMPLVVEAESPEGANMEGGRIGYIAPDALQEGDVERLMEEFADTKGIIVDLRQYPSVPVLYLLSEYFIPEPRVFAAIDCSNPLRPGNFCRLPFEMSGAGYSKMMGLSDRDDYPLYEGKVVLLINEFSQSQSETTAMGLRQAPRAVVVGSPSIGADGDVAEMNLPGKLLVTFSTMGFYTPEGEPIQRVGVQPDVFCRPTAEDLRQGRDALMETAIDLILASNT